MSSATKEIVTFQFGHYSNYVGTHWWNIQNSSFVYHPSQKTGQKELNSDVLFREGQNLLGDVTYTPRLIAFDLKGSLNALKQTDTLYDLNNGDDDVHWSNDVTLHRASTAAKNEYLQGLERKEAIALGRGIQCYGDMDEGDDACSESASLPEGQAAISTDTKLYHLDDAVKVWSDFLCPHLHPRSVHIINSYLHDIENDPFALFMFGCDVYAGRHDKSEIEDRLHFFTEECDHLQGFQLLIDAYNGFGGMSTSLLDEISDDFSQKGVLAMSVTPASFVNASPVHSSYRALNTALTYNRILQSSNALLVPLSTSTDLWRWPASASSIEASCVRLPHVQYKADLMYHTSAILAAAIDSATSPYRLVDSQLSLNDLSGALAIDGRKVVGLDAIFPFEIHESSSFTNTARKLAVPPPFVSLLPSSLSDVQPHAMSVVASGVELDSAVGFGVDNAVASYINRHYSSSLNAVSTLHQPCKVTAPFPNIFSPYLTTTGQLSSHQRPANKGVESVPTLTALKSSLSAKGHLSALLTEIKKLSLQRVHRASEAGLEADDLRETVDSLDAYCQLYDDDGGQMV